jgi:corrinoid protein of di/trimethylamine methyltransferase
MTSGDLFLFMTEAVVKGDKPCAIELAKKTVEMNIDPHTAIEESLTPAMAKVGELWDEGEYFLPELVMSAEAMKAGMDILKCELKKQNESMPSMGTIVIGTVEGDIHDIGKTIVAALLGAAGFRVIDLGADVPAEKFINEAKAHNADIIGMSALLTTTMFGQKRLIEKLNLMGIRENYKIIVGGAPVSQKWANEIGADAAPKDAMEAVRVTKELMAAAKTPQSP